MGPSQLWENYCFSDYPMVLWQLPLEDEFVALVDLRPNLKPQPHELELLESGFMINTFEAAHPPKSYFLKGDLVLKWHSHPEAEVQTTVDPRVSATEVDAFLSSRGSQSNHIINKPARGKSTADYQQLVEKALGDLRQGTLQKVVLSRFEDHQLPHDFSVFQAFESMAAKYPNAMKYAFYLPGIGTWMGATPEELLTIKDSRIFKTVALAGTQVIPEGLSPAEIGWRQKEIEEQAMVSRYIIDCFKKIRLREFEEKGPRTAKAGNLGHLKTEFRVDMTETNTPNLGSIMLDLLHPTSAVCGMPLRESMNFILENEGYDRGFYAGFLGPVNFEGNTNLFVNLRCMQQLASLGRFYAGAGITIDSVAEKEFEETSAKLKTMKSVILNS